jgi:antitoxin component of MazEF toxin-antitoxin module
MYPYNFNRGQTIQTSVPGIVADMGFLANLSWAALETVAADTDGIFDGIVAGDATAEPAGTTVTATVESDEFVAQPPCARNVTITVAATTAGHVKAAAIVVTGKNLADETITESFTPTVDTPATLVGAKAFKSITSVAVPAQDGDSVTVDVGFGQLIGLPYKLAKKRVLLTLNDGVVDTAPTLTISTSALESNTVDFNGSLDGSVMDMSIIV